MQKHLYLNDAIMQKFYIFYHDYTPEIRAKKMYDAAKKNHLKPKLIITNDLIFQNNEVFYKNKRFLFNKNDLHWAISSTLILDTVAFIASLHDVKIYPIYNASNFTDKYRAQCFFKSINIPTPQTTLLITTNYADYIKNFNTFPYVIKKTRGSEGRDVDLVYSIDDINSFIATHQKIKHVPLKSNAFILQKFIKESAGSDYRVLCLQNNILGIIKRTAKEGFKSNVSLGGDVQHIESHPELEAAAKKIMNKSGLFMAGIDFIESNSGPLAIEINASPQFEGFEKATQIDVAEQIIKALLKQ